MTSFSSTYILDLSSPSAQEALVSGYLEHGGDRHRVIARDSILVPGARARVIFEALAQPFPLLPAYRRYWPAFRPSSLLSNALTCLAVSLYGWTASGPRTWHFLTALTAFAGVTALQIAVNLFNDVEDHMKLIDYPGSPGGSGVIQKGWLTPQEMMGFAKWALVAGILLGLPTFAFLHHTLLLAGIALVAGAGVLGYSGKPFGLKYRALGDLAIFLLCGPGLAVGFEIASFDQASLGALWIGLFFGLSAATQLHSKNLHDIEQNTRRGALTLAGGLGFRKAQKLLPLLYFSQFGLLILGISLGYLTPWTLLAPLGALPQLFKLCQRTLRASGPASPLLAGVRSQTLETNLRLGILFCLALFLAGFRSLLG